jgi:hypothetical protein
MDDGDYRFVSCWYVTPSFNRDAVRVYEMWNLMIRRRQDR